MTPEYWKSIFHYDDFTGKLHWVKASKTTKAGDSVKTINKKGYVQFGHKGKCYLAHRIIWAIVYGEYPKHYIDHIDGNPSNNKLDNLRDATSAINQQNFRKASKRSKTGLLGVSSARPGKYFASIRANGKYYYLGWYSDPQEAHEAYLKAKRVLHEGNTL